MAATASAARDESLARLAGLGVLIGRTPLLEVHFTLDGHPRRLFAKYEQRSMTGSIKDRMAFWILRTAYQTGAIHPGDTIVEATSGNTGIAFAAVGRALGHPVRIYMPDWMSRERVALIEAFGAEIVPVSKERGGFLGSIALADEWAEQHDHAFLPHQFANLANIEAHAATTGPEILCQLRGAVGEPDAFIAGVGTGGTVMGVGRALRSGVKNRPVRIHPLEPAESPTLRTGCKIGRHRIQGISDEFVPRILDLAELDPVVDVNDGDAILMAQQLCRAGLSLGISSGANFIGAVKLIEELGADAVVATVFPDSNKKYLSTDLYRNEPVRPGYLSPRIAGVHWRGHTCPMPSPAGQAATHSATPSATGFTAPQPCTCGFRDSCP